VWHIYVWLTWDMQDVKILYYNLRRLECMSSVSDIDIFTMCRHICYQYHEATSVLYRWFWVLTVVCMSVCKSVHTSLTKVALLLALFSITLLKSSDCSVPLGMLYLNISCNSVHRAVTWWICVKWLWCILKYVSFHRWYIVCTISWMLSVMWLRSWIC